MGPGLFFIIPCIDEIKIVDLRTITFDVPPQEILTKDSVTVQGNFPKQGKLNLKIVCLSRRRCLLQHPQPNGRCLQD